MKEATLTLLIICLGLFTARAQTSAPAVNHKTEKDLRAVTVTMPDNAYVTHRRIELSPSRFFVLEFPSGDEVSIITPQNLSLLHLDEALAKQMNPRMPIVVRAGVFWKGDSEPTYITVLMTSGAFLQLDVFPAKSMFESADRISWRYNPASVRRAREGSLQAQPAEERKIDRSADAGPTFNPASLISSVSPESKLAVGKGPDKSTSTKLKRKETDDEIKAKEIADGALVAGVYFKPPKKDKLYKSAEFQLFGPPSRWANGGVWTVSVVGVKNKTRHSLQLTGAPNLQIETRGKKGDSLNVEPLKPLAMKTTAQSSPIILAPSATTYFSFVYRTPLLGINQSLSFAVSNTNAADAPVTFNLKPGASF